MSEKLDPIVIAAAKRTPIGSFQGALAGLVAPKLGAIAIVAALAEAGLNEVDEVLMGNVLGAGVGQNPARQAALAVVVAGGMESMSNVPYLLPKARGGLRLGHGEVKDHMFTDGLEDAYSGRLMGSYAEDTAQAYQFSRQAQDAYALGSLKRAIAAISSGAFTSETVTVNEPAVKGCVSLAVDEQPGRADPTRIPQLRPAFREGGTVTAANSSSISDGAAALVLMRRSEAERRGIRPLARIAGHAGHAREPGQFTTAPVGAVQALLAKLDWPPGSVELYEVNEAFAVVAMVAMRDLGLPADIVNVNGGACALGHPIGASGVRIIVTLLHAMAARGARRGIASLCIGGGEATAVAIERQPV
ncbi:MAG: acetyl-CoA C-acyltransferase [Rhizobiales bacterium]|nr:acetyl-CoA C-acyltransferase [Hyphomicrobiales bacterium]